MRRPMRDMKGLAAAAIAAAVLMPTAGAAQVKLVYSSYLASTFSTTHCDGWFMEEVTKRTDGEVTFETYYSSSLLNAVDTFPGIGRGAADLGMSYPSAYNRDQYPLSNIVMPFITDNPIAATLAFNDLYSESPALQSEYEKHNVKLLYSMVSDIHTVWSRERIGSAEDLEGKRIRAVLAPADAIEMLGGTPVAMQWPDAVEALQRGAIDAFANSPFDMGVKAGLDDVSNYVTDAGGMGTYAVSATAMNLQKWNSLSPEVQSTMLEVADEVPDCYFEIVRQDVQEAVDELGKEQNVELVTFAPEEAQRIREVVGEQLWQEWVDTANQHGYDGQKLLDRYLELVEKHEANTTYKTGFELYKEQYGS